MPPHPPRTRKRKGKAAPRRPRRPDARRAPSPARLVLAALDTPEKRKLHDLVKERPRQVSNFKQLAALLRADGRHDAAAALLRRALALHPGDRDLVSHLARTHCEAGKASLAIALYKRLIRSDPDDPAPYERIDRICRDHGMFEEAVRLYRGIDRGGALRERSHERLHFLLVEKLRDLDRGIENLEEAIRGFGPTYRRCKDLGRLYAKKGNWPEAARFYRMALDLKSDDADLTGLLGWALAESGRDREAEECFRRVRGTFQGGASLAELYLRQGRLAEAEAELAALGARYAGNSRVAIGRAELLLKRGDAGGARGICEEALRRTPPYFAFELAHGHEVLASACAKEGDAAAAARHERLSRALRAGPDTYTAIVTLGEKALASGDLGAAEGAFDRLLELYAGNSRALAGKCEILLRRGDARGAVELGEMAIRNANPKYRDEQARCHRILARAYRSLRQPGKAARHRARAQEPGRAQ